MRLRALGSAPALPDTLARGCFAGCVALRAFALLPELAMGDCAAFVREYLRPERLALGVIQPLPRKD